MYGLTPHGVAPYGISSVEDDNVSVEWQGNIGKTSLTVSNKLMITSLGYTNVVNKSTLNLQPDQLQRSTGFGSSIVKRNLPVNTKSLNRSTGFASAIVKRNLPISLKQLAVAAGASLPFTGVLNKATYALTPKQLRVVAGWSNSASKLSLSISGKVEGVQLGRVLNLTEQNLTLQPKTLTAQTGTSVSFLGEIVKGQLNVATKPLGATTGQALSFTGSINKTSLTLSGKTLSSVRGMVLDIQKESFDLVTKSLTFGLQQYPIVPIERIFTLTDKGRTFLFKQITTVYIIK
jgi:hypothetical protein